MREQSDVSAGQLASCLHVVVNLVVEATLQFGAQSGELLRVERYVLVACGVGAHADKVLHPCGAAQLTATRSGATDASCLLSCADLFHLNAHVESVGEHLDELSEVDALVCNVVENGFVAVALIFHIADFHLQSQLFGYLSALNHGVMFAAFRLVILLHVYGFGYAVDALYVVGRLQVRLLYL